MEIRTTGTRRKSLLTAAEEVRAMCFNDSNVLFLLPPTFRPPVGVKVRRDNSVFHGRASPIEHYFVPSSIVQFREKD
ncbi:hypothetical protein TNCV_4933551 [Trichonephila clavipes]|nr:hypothetical protein TNCV_4933551 [Trichonephila clavipes]